MRRPSKTLSGTISDRAILTFPQDLIFASDGWELYQEHWLKTAEKFYSELEAEGLVETCKKVREIIDFNKSLVTTCHITPS